MSTFTLSILHGLFTKAPAAVEHMKGDPRINGLSVMQQRQKTVVPRENSAWIVVVLSWSVSRSLFPRLHACRLLMIVARHKTPHPASQSSFLPGPAVAAANRNKIMVYFRVCASVSRVHHLRCARTVSCRAVSTYKDVLAQVVTRLEVCPPFTEAALDPLRSFVPIQARAFQYVHGALLLGSDSHEAHRLGGLQPLSLFHAFGNLQIVTERR